MYMRIRSKHTKSLHILKSKLKLLYFKLFSLNKQNQGVQNQDDYEKPAKEEYEVTSSDTESEKENKISDVQNNQNEEEQPSYEQIKAGNQELQDVSFNRPKSKGNISNELSPQHVESRKGSEQMLAKENPIQSDTISEKKKTDTNETIIKDNKIKNLTILPKNNKKVDENNQKKVDGSLKRPEALQIKQSLDDKKKKKPDNLVGESKKINIPKIEKKLHETIKKEIQFPVKKIAIIDLSRKEEKKPEFKRPVINYKEIKNREKPQNYEFFPKNVEETKDPKIKDQEKMKDIPKQLKSIINF